MTWDSVSRASSIHLPSISILSLSFFLAIGLKRKLLIDDALEVSVVHGWTGAIGSLAVGFVADLEENASTQPGVLYGGSWKFVGVQVLGVTVAGVYA